MTDSPPIAPLTPPAMPDIPEWTYATSFEPGFRRWAVRVLERLAGQRQVARIYREFRQESHPPDLFWQKVIDKIEVTADLDTAALAAVPREGPLVIVANHPFGVLDGIVVCWLAEQVRGQNFRILTNSVLTQAPEVAHQLLPIDFAGTREAVATNLRTRGAALSHLADGGCVVVFPGGAVSTAPKPFARQAVDPEWKLFTSKLVRRSRATVLPVYFSGQNSRLFQIASHVAMTLRLALLLKEARDRIGTRVPLTLGRPLPHAEIAHLEARDLMIRLRAEVYGLADRA